MFLQFSTYKFEGIKLPQSWSNSKETLYGQIPIIGSKPTVQRTGDKLEEIELGIFLSSDFCTPKTELENLNKLRSGGVVSNLIDGEGNNYGKFVITAVTEDVINTLPSGYVTGISATLKLLEYNTTAAITTKVPGKAYTSQYPIAEVPLTPLVSPMRGVLITTTAGNVSAKALSDQIAKGQMSVGKLKQLQQNADKAKAAYNEATAKIDTVRKAVLRGSTKVKLVINDLVTNVNNVKVIAARLQTAQEQIQNIPGAVLGADSLQDYADLATNGELISGSLYALNVASAPFAAVVGSRECN